MHQSFGYIPYLLDKNRGAVFRLHHRVLRIIILRILVDLVAFILELGGDRRDEMEVRRVRWTAKGLGQREAEHAFTHATRASEENIVEVVSLDSGSYELLGRILSNDIIEVVSHVEL